MLINAPPGRALDADVDGMEGYAAEDDADSDHCDDEAVSDMV